MKGKAFSRQLGPHAASNCHVLWDVREGVDRWMLGSRVQCKGRGVGLDGMILDVRV